MFERFTERARQIVVLAQEEARQHRHGVITPEHLLVAAAREEEGVAARVLASLDLTPEALRDKFYHQQYPEAVEGQIPFTHPAKKALELALREALSLGHNYIGTEHVLLGLIRDDHLFEPEEAQEVRDTVMRVLIGTKQRPKSKPERPIEFCRDCRDEMSIEDVIDGKPCPPAEFIIWGKLSKPEALGPKCYDHAAKHLGHAAMSRIDQYAVLDLRKLQRKS
jgi:ATP-dependent Clp protease ATP-binding subunit ClpA